MNGNDGEAVSGLQSRDRTWMGGLSLVKDPTAVIKAAVRGMVPKNKLAAERLARLRVFVDENHTHAAQQPKKVEVKRG